MSGVINICPVCASRDVRQINKPKSLNLVGEGAKEHGRKMRDKEWRIAYVSRPLDYWFECLNQKCKAIWRV